VANGAEGGIFCCDERCNFPAIVIIIYRFKCCYKLFIHSYCCRGAVSGQSRRSMTCSKECNIVFKIFCYHCINRLCSIGLQTMKFLKFLNCFIFLTLTTCDKHWASCCQCFTSVNIFFVLLQFAVFEPSNVGGHLMAYG